MLTNRSKVKLTNYSYQQELGDTQWLLNEPVSSRLTLFGC